MRLDYFFGSLLLWEILFLHFKTKWSLVNNYRSTSEGWPKPFGHPSLIVMQEWTHSLWELTSSFVDLSTLGKINKSRDIVNNFSFLFEPTLDNERLTYTPNLKFPLLKEDDVFSDVIKIHRSWFVNIIYNLMVLKI